MTLLERGGPDHDSCSLGNAGMVVPSHFVPLAAPGMVALGLSWMWNPESPFYIKPRLSWDLLNWGFKFWCAANRAHVQRSAPLLWDLSLASRSCFEELAAERNNDFGLVQKGLLMLCKTGHALVEEARNAAQARVLGLPVEVLDAKQAAALDGGVYFPKDCHLNPAQFTAGLTGELQRLGARFEWNAEVLGWRAGDSGIAAVCTPRGEFQADHYVLAGGSWSPLAARELGLKLPIQAGKGYSLTLPRPRQLPSVCAIFTEARVAVTPMGGTLRFGGTMEIAGLNEAINPRRVQGTIKAAPRYYPEFREEDFAGIQPWRGLRPCSSAKNRSSTWRCWTRSATADPVDPAPRANGSGFPAWVACRVKAPRARCIPKLSMERRLVAGFAPEPALGPRVRLKPAASRRSGTVGLIRRQFRLAPARASGASQFLGGV